MSGLDIE
uniref:Uncharacterized protein n=1 Tax=Acrobeloides nanus TaxID=290746 RepID=A0A914CMX3_9BILA